MKSYDLIVIGFGKAGKTLAGKFASLGQKVALIEKDAHMYGGTCINVGCIPSKRLVREARFAPKDDFNKQEVYYANIIKEKIQFISMLRKANYDKLVSMGVEILDGKASFINDHEILITDKDGSLTTIYGEKIVINTGSTPITPNIVGIQKNENAILSNQMLSLETLPKKLTIIGGGYIGVEFASIYAGFGSQVTIIQNGKEFLPKEDRDIAQAIFDILKGKGVEIILEAEIKEVKGSLVFYKKEDRDFILDGEMILLATGRAANTKGLNLENAGVKYDAQRGIEVNDYLQTSKEHIFAAGDVVGHPQFTYLSLDDSRIIAGMLTGEKHKTTLDRGALSYCLFLEPAFSRVGLSEAEAMAQGYDIRILKMATNLIPKAKVLKETEGFLKAIINQENGQILGAHFICPQSYEMINMVKLAMDHGLDYRVLRDFIYTHPTMSESFNDLFGL